MLGLAMGVTLLPLASACVPDRPTRGPVDRLLLDIACADHARLALRMWGASDPVPGQIPDPDGGRSVRMPAGAPGNWVVMTVWPDRAPRLLRATPTTLTERRFASDCTPMDGRVARVGPPTGGFPAFTDADLAQVVAGHDEPVVVYVWSPHMPLSVDGWTEIAEATARVGWRVVPVVMPYSDEGFVRSEAARVGLAESAGVRMADANELLYRDGLVHAPSVIVFTRERVSPVLPGYRNAAGYLRYFEAFAAGRPGG